MFSELTGSFFNLVCWTDEKIRELLSLNIFGENDTLWCVKTIFLCISLKVEI